MATSEAELKKVLGEDLMEKQASEKLVEEVNKYSANEEVVALYMDLTREELERNTYIAEAKEEGLAEGLKEGLQEGFEKGQKQEKLAIARNLLNKNIDKETIKEVTGLTIKEIENL